MRTSRLTHIGIHGIATVVAALFEVKVQVICDVEVTGDIRLLNSDCV